MAVEIGKKAPEICLPDTDRKIRMLSEFKRKKVILAFFPGAFTSVCTKEMCSFRDSMNKLNSLDAQVVAVSVDSPFSNKAFAEKNDLKFPILSDYKKAFIKVYDIQLKDFGGIRGLTVAKRSVFILDRDQIVRYKWVSDDPGVEPNYDGIIEALSKIK
jgi:peroxiredoxin